GRLGGGRGLGGLSLRGPGGVAPVVEALHVDASAKRGAVGDHDPRRQQIADHAPIRRDLHFVLGADVADHHARDARRLHTHVGFDHARVFDQERLRRLNLRVDAPLDDQILVALELAANDDGGADRRRGRRAFRAAVLFLGHQSTPISMLPLNLAPSAMITRGALMSPIILPSLRTSTRSEATTLPTSIPLTARFFVVMVASTLPELSTVRSFFD